MLTILICVHGIHMGLHTSTLTGAMYYVGLLFLMGTIYIKLYNFRVLGINCFSSCRDELALNINSGHSEENSSNQLLAVQTPATDFSVNTNNVSYI